MSDRHTIFMAGVTRPNIVDLESGKKRPGAKEIQTAKET